MAASRGFGGLTAASLLWVAQLVLLLDHHQHHHGPSAAAMASRSHSLREAVKKAKFSSSLTPALFGGTARPLEQQGLPADALVDIIAPGAQLQPEHVDDGGAMAGKAYPSLVCAGMPVLQQSCLMMLSLARGGSRMRVRCPPSSHHPIAGNDPRTIDVHRR